MEFVLWSYLTGVYVPGNRDFCTDGEFREWVWAVRLRLSWLMGTDERYELDKVVRQIMQEVQELIHEIHNFRHL
jgi:hypothetical protein